MSLKFYKEIIDFLESQREVLSSFEKDNKILMANNPEVVKLLQTLKYNLGLLEENINKIIERSE